MNDAARLSETPWGGLGLTDSSKGGSVRCQALAIYSLIHLPAFAENHGASKNLDICSFIDFLIVPEWLRAFQ